MILNHTVFALSPWTLLLQHQSLHVWCARNLKEKRSPVVPGLGLSAFHLKKKESLKRDFLTHNWSQTHKLSHTHKPFSAPEKIEMILLRGFFSSGTDGSGLVLWLASSVWSFPPPLKIVLLILTGGAGGLSSWSRLSHMIQGEMREKQAKASKKKAESKDGWKRIKCRKEPEKLELKKRISEARCTEEGKCT